MQLRLNGVAANLKTKKAGTSYPMFRPSICKPPTKKTARTIQAHQAQRLAWSRLFQRYRDKTQIALRVGNHHMRILASS